MTYQLGIDLGTTYTAAAVCRSSDRRWVEPESITLGTRTATVPSVLFVPADGSVVVGEAAERRALTDPDRVVREFKRRVGDPTPLVVGGRAWPAEELCAQVVRWVVDRVAEREGGPASRIAVAHPASWGPHKKELLAGALRRVGLSWVSFLAEPQAAALHYAAAERVEPGSTIAVYDLGGGTFDAAVVRKDAHGFGLLGRPEGVERLGGVDFDQSVFEHVRAGMPEAFAELDDTDEAVLAAVAQLRRECREAKEALSADTEVSIPVLLPGARGAVRLHRSEFEALIRDRVEETVGALRRAVGSAGMAPEALSTVLLVGGSSRIPLVAQLVSEQLGRPVAVDADPKNAIAKGAALAVSPKPTHSWPSGALAPLAAGAATAVVENSGPPRPAPSPPPTPARPAAAVAHQPHRSGGTLLASPEPARPPLAEPEVGWDYEPEPIEERRHRPPGLLIGIGGLLAVLAIMLVLLLMSAGSDEPTAGRSTGSGGVSAETSSPPEPTPAAPAPAPAPQTTTGGSGSTDSDPSPPAPQGNPAPGGAPADESPVVGDAPPAEPTPVPTETPETPVEVPQDPVPTEPPPADPGTPDTGTGAGEPLPTGTQTVADTPPTQLPADANTGIPVPTQPTPEPTAIAERAL